MRQRLAVFLATSGHSGVDRIMKMLLPSIASRGIKVDLLHIRNHGPYMEQVSPNLGIVELGSSHTYSSLGPLTRYLRTEKPDVILSDKDRVNQVALAARWLSAKDTRVVVRFGQTVTRFLAEQTLWQKAVHHLSMRFIYRSADAIITPSGGAARDLSLFARIPEGRIIVVPNPVNIREIRDLAAQPVDHPWFQNNNTAVIVGLGELTSRKGFDTLIKAFAILRRKKPVKFFLMGKGSGRGKLEKLCYDLGIKDDVEFAGFKDNPFPFLAKADLFVQPSRYEGFGMALLEALTLGIPVVATDCPSGPREILCNGRYGQLVPVGDPGSMASAMEETLVSPKDPDYLMTAAERYGIESVTDHYMNLFGFSS